MRRALSSAQSRAVDLASPQHGRSTLDLMETAGEALAKAALREASGASRFFILCGTGNNGGDGFVAARYLTEAKREVFAEVVGDVGKIKGDAKTVFDKAGVSFAQINETATEDDIVIDALFGTGLNRAPDGAAADAIAQIDEWRAKGLHVVSADLPSGVDGDTGEAKTPAVTADVTVSFGYLKAGHIVEPGASRSGRVEVVELGFPTEAHGAITGPATWLLEEHDAQERLKKRSADTHKGSYGHLLVVAGSAGKSGASALSGLGALRSGAGLVTIATRSAVVDSVLRHAPELMGAALPAEGPLGLADLNALLDAADGKDAVVIGPGIQRGDDTHRLLSALLEELHVPVVLDADALNALEGHLEVLESAQSPVILTPHPGEFARLTGKSTADIQRDRLGVAREFVKANPSLLILKGARTLIARDDGTVFVNPTGNPGMATAGSGDVLAGVLGALLAQGLMPPDAAIAGVWAHGAAGDLIREKRGELGLIASDLLDGLTELWRLWDR